MPAGSHKDAFKAHQKVKRIFNRDGVNRLPKMAADILLDFVKNQRQINRETMPDTIPSDDERYDRPHGAPEEPLADRFDRLGRRPIPVHDHPVSSTASESPPTVSSDTFRGGGPSPDAPSPS